MEKKLLVRRSQGRKGRTIELLEEGHHVILEKDLSGVKGCSKEKSNAGFEIRA